MPLGGSRHFRNEKLSFFTLVSTRDCRSRSEECKAGAPNGHLLQPSASAELSAPTTGIILALWNVSAFGFCHSSRYPRSGFGIRLGRIWMKPVP